VLLAGVRLSAGIGADHLGHSRVSIADYGHEVGINPLASVYLPPLAWELIYAVKAAG
jgi:hypothetical protein